MYIDKFVAGVLTTLFVEVAFLVIFVITHTHRINIDEEDKNERP